MKPLLIRLGVTLVVIGLAIFGYAEAWGGEVWILWSRGVEEPWRIENDFPSFDQCRKAQKIKCNDLVESFRKKGIWKEIVIRDDCNEVIADGNYLMYLKCLPDSIDPRK